MNEVITYLNTDLDLTSEDDLNPLATALTAGEMCALHVTRADNGLWYATFETEVQHTEPEPNIGSMLAVVESLTVSLRAVWDRCERREFNIGYDCGAEPWAFNQGLSAALTGRIASAGASLRWTLYPDREAKRDTNSS